jgi:hypothetical protein
MVNYKLGKIYRLECNVTGLVYIGSTCEPTLAKRLTKHVASYRSYLKGFGNRYVSSFKILENNDYDIILIEKYPCNDIDELHSRECYFTNQIDCVNIRKNQGLINRMGGKKEYQKEYQKEYHNDNKEYQKEYHKEYYNDNKDKIKEYDKEYRKLNKDNIARNRKEKHECECGGKYTHENKSKHFKTKKHIQYTEQQNEEV